jgi:hypothetical protein
VVLALADLTMTAAATAHDSARWDAAAQLVAEGVAPTDIAAGLEWTGWHAPGPYGLPRPGFAAWTGSFAGSRDCWLVAASPQDRPGYRLDRTVGYRPLLVAGRATLLVYAGDQCEPDTRTTGVPGGDG